MYNIYTTGLDSYLTIIPTKFTIQLQHKSMLLNQIILHVHDKLRVIQSFYVSVEILSARSNHDSLLLTMV